MVIFIIETVVIKLCVFFDEHIVFCMNKEINLLFFIRYFKNWVGTIRLKIKYDLLVYLAKQCF